MSTVHTLVTLLELLSRVCSDCALEGQINFEFLNLPLQYQGGTLAQFIQRYLCKCIDLQLLWLLLVARFLWVSQGLFQLLIVCSLVVNWRASFVSLKQGIFFFSLTWSLGATSDAHGRVLFDALIRELIEVASLSANQADQGSWLSSGMTCFIITLFMSCKLIHVLRYCGVSLA